MANNDGDGPGSHAASNTAGRAAAVLAAESGLSPASPGASLAADEDTRQGAPGTSLPLQRNPSLASTHSHSSRSSRLSTPSQRSSSGGSSLASAARMSVDDILSNPQLSRGARQKRRRAGSSKERKHNVGAQTAVQSGGVAVPKEGRRLSNTVGAEAKPPAKRRPQDPRSNPGAEERRRRLERLQREKLQRRVGQTTKRKAPQSGLVKSSLEGPGPVPSSGKRPLERQPTDESTVERASGGTGEEEGPEQSEPTPRRSKRAKGVASYNVSELARNNVSSSPPIPPEETSLPLEVEGEPSVAPPPSQQSTMEMEEEPETAEAALEALLSKYAACVEPSKAGGATPSPWDVAKIFSILLPRLNLFDADYVKGDECRRVQQELGGVLKSTEWVRREVMTRDAGDGGEEGNNARLLRMIQIQVWIRMMIWTMENEVGLEFVRGVIAMAGDDAKSEAGGKKGKGKKKSKKKKRKKGAGAGDVSPRQSLIDDLKAFMGLAPYVLHRSLDFSQWLRDTLTLGFREPIPDYGAELFDHFEISIGEPITLRRHGTDASQQSGRSERSQVSHSPVKGDGSAGGTKGGSPTNQLMERRTKRQQAYFASLADEEKANSTAADDESATITGSLSTVTSTSRASSLREKDDITLFQTSVSLTATASTKSRNPFLKGSARGQYVGSHMSTKLSNISSLFREVKAAPKPKPNAKSARKKAPSESRRKDPPERLVAKMPSVVTSTTPAAAIARPNAKPGRRLLPSSPPGETPMKRARPAASSRAASSRGAPAFSVQATPGPVVEETPAFQRAGGRPSISRAIVAETPQQQSRVLPTMLWSARPGARQSLNLSRPSQRQARGGSNGSGNQAGALSYGFSPTPHGEDVSSAVAEAARAARKRK
ncbi:hypothetical protein ACHAXT_011886 [Thalassiosira profunda]